MIGMGAKMIYGYDFVDDIHSRLSSGHCDEDLTKLVRCSNNNSSFNSPILILRTHNPVTTKGDHQWVLQRLFLVEPSRQLAISVVFRFLFAFLYPVQQMSRGIFAWQKVSKFVNKVHP